MEPRDRSLHDRSRIHRGIMGETIVKIIGHLVVLLVGFSGISSVLASDFDGTHPLICATIEASDCVLGEPCFTGEAKEVGAPAFMRINFDQKTITGTERTTPIVAMEKNEDQLLMQGAELGYGWSMAINQVTGDFAGSMTNFKGTFLLFGSCALD